MQKTKLPSLVTILILTLITALMWIGFNVYRAFTQKPVPSVPSEISQPLTPTLDQDTINKIQSSLFFDQSQIPQLTITGSPLPAPVSLPSPSLRPQPSASPSATPTITPSPLPTP
jgi:hypothetical protein